MQIPFINKITGLKPDVSGINVINNYDIAEYLKPLPSINAILTEKEAVALYKAVYHLKVPGNVVEIGTWRGGSALIIASALKNSNSNKILHTVDPFNSERDVKSKKYLAKDMKILGIKNLKDNYYYVRTLLKKFKLIPYVKIHISRSADTAKNWKTKCSFVFIDGNHTFSSVKNDILLWGNLCNPGGLLAIHDYKNKKSNMNGLPGPTIAANKLLKNNNNWEYCGMTDSLIFFRKKRFGV